MILRLVTPEDEVLLRRWRNDPGTLAGLLDGHPVTKEEHRKWLHAALAVHLPLYIAEHDGIPLGVGRLDLRQEIAITVAPEHRGRGYATPLIQALQKKAHAPLLARVRPQHWASMRAFGRAGFHHIPAEWYEP